MRMWQSDKKMRSSMNSALHVVKLACRDLKAISDIIIVCLHEDMPYCVNLCKIQYCQILTPKDIIVHQNGNIFQPKIY